MNSPKDLRPGFDRAKEVLALLREHVDAVEKHLAEAERLDAAGEAGPALFAAIGGRAAALSAALDGGNLAGLLTTIRWHLAEKRRA